MANVIKSIANYIRRNPETEEAATLRDLCRALEEDGSFELNRLFSMKNKAFELALAVLEEWRFDRHVVERRLQKYLGQAEESDAG